MLRTQLKDRECGVTGATSQVSRVRPAGTVMPINFVRRCRCELAHDFAFFIRTDEGNEVFEHRAFLHEGASLDHVGFRLDQATHSTTNYTTQLLHRKLTIGARLAFKQAPQFRIALVATRPLVGCFATSV